MKHMRKTSVRELHIHTSELVREAAEGWVIVIERRGEPVAELRPISVPKALSKELVDEIFASMQELWDRSPQLPDSTYMISEDRDR